MVNVSVEVEGEGQSPGLACAKIAADAWELNVRARPDEFETLRSVRSATWATRSSLAVGTAAGVPAFWSFDGATVSIMIGSDDKTWDVAVSVPVEVVDRIVELVGHRTM